MSKPLASSRRQHLQRPLLQRRWHLLFFIYFAQHLLFMLIMDLQAIFYIHYPAWLQRVYAFYVELSLDPLMQGAVYRPNSVAWFRSFIWCELLFQLPFFPVALYCLYKDRVAQLRIPMIIYGTHTATTLIPIFAQVRASIALSDLHKHTLTLVYLPYFVLPIIIVLYFGLWHPTERIMPTKPIKKAWQWQRNGSDYSH